MSLRASLLQQLENPSLTKNQRAELGCDLARQFEDVGDYEGAREAIAEFWRKIGEPLEVEGLDESTAAELLLRAGTLTGWLGNNRQANGAQEEAKNLITEAARIFAALTSQKKVLEAQTELAYCYWRQGEYDEARIILTEVIEQLTTDSALKAKAVLRLAIVECSATRFNHALRTLTDYAPLFERITNHTIKGGYHNELAIVLRNLGTSENREDYLDRAFVEYEAAAYYFEQAGHIPYCALVENNLGFILFKAGKLKEAHEHLERARRLFSLLKDKGTAAQVDDTRARVLLTEGRNEEAERVARSAVRALENGGRQSLLAEALTTQGIALARLGLHNQARRSLYRAIEVAYQSGALNDAGEAALTLIEELGDHLPSEDMRSVYARAAAWYEASQHLETLRRLCRAAERILSKEREEDEKNAPTTGTLRKLMREYEKKILREALQRADGSVTHAARLLGLTHQAVTYMIEKRHPDLLGQRTPKLRRRRSIIKKQK